MVTCPLLEEGLPSADVCSWAWTEKLFWQREHWGGLAKRLKAPGLPESFAAACLAAWRGDLLGKPGPSKYFSVSPLMLKSQESFSSWPWHVRFIGGPWKMCCCGEKWTWPPFLLSDTLVAWWEAVIVLQAGHGLWPLVCSAQNTDDWKHLIFLFCK